MTQIPFPTPSSSPALRFSGWIPPLTSASITIDYLLPTNSTNEQKPSNYELTLEPQLAHTPYIATVSLEKQNSPAIKQSLEVESQTVLQLP
jgi:hypothetical protein